MIVVVFEVTVKPEVGQRYFDIAAELRPLLDEIDGFISIERFKSLATENKFVSLSFWRDEAAVREWRENTQHNIAQELGRQEIFADFSISVAEVVRQYGMRDATKDNA